MKTKLSAALIVAVIALAAATVSAFINPSFTPIDLVKQSDTVLQLEFTKVSDQGLATAVVKSILKGKFDLKEVTVDLMASAFPEQGKAVIDQINGGNKEAMLFVGVFQGEGITEGGPSEETKGFLHVGRNPNYMWLILGQGKEGSWDLEKSESKMLGTWAGTVGSLLNCVKYVLADEAATVPVNEGVEWGEAIAAGKLEGKFSAAQAVDLEGKGKPDLFLAGATHDKVFRCVDGKFTDVTAKVDLKSNSLVATWADFNADGKVDLASWDGKELKIFAQKADGTFTATALSLGEALKEGCLYLTTFDTGAGAVDAKKPHVGILVGTKASPVLLTPKDDGTFSAKPLASGEFPAKELGGKELGDAAECLLADFDGDNLPDVVQLFANGGLFYKGRAPGEFLAPVKTQVGSNKGRHAACLADLDANGLPEIIVVSADHRNLIFENLGGGKFQESLDVSGEIGYIAKNGGIAVQASDINNDGRQDVLVVYGTEMAPHLFFNRGFACFGHARMVDLVEQKILPQAGKGQQAGCLGDFNGDGAVDMALLLIEGGELWLLPRKVDGHALVAVAAFSPAAACAGPVTVKAFNDKWPLGSWTVRAGEAGGFFGLPEAGQIKLQWQVPGGKLMEKVVTVEDKPVRVLLDQVKEKDAK